jgi:hypothetical protein
MALVAIVGLFGAGIYEIITVFAPGLLPETQDPPEPAITFYRHATCSPQYETSFWAHLDSNQGPRDYES